MFFFFSSRGRHARFWRAWISDVCSSYLAAPAERVLRVSAVRAASEPRPDVPVVAAGDESMTAPLVAPRGWELELRSCRPPAEHRAPGAARAPVERDVVQARVSRLDPAEDGRAADRGALARPHERVAWP